MNPLRLLPSLLLASFIAAPTARASTPRELVLSERGEIRIETDTLPGLEIRTDVRDVSTGEWKHTRVVQKCAPAQGPAIERTETRAFLDGTEVAHTVKAEIANDTVTVAASWIPSGAAKGFSRVDLWIPDTLLDDLVLTLGDATIFPRAEAQPIRTYQNTGPVVAKRKSNGEFLFQLTGDYLSVTPAYYPENPNTGLTLRLLNVPTDNTANIGDKTELNWSLSFKE